MFRYSWDIGREDFFFFKQKTAYDIVDCDWSSDVCSSDLKSGGAHVWMFLSEPIEAEEMQRRITELSAALGFSGSEIFPKQTTILKDRGDTGNFLNIDRKSVV